MLEFLDIESPAVRQLISFIFLGAAGFIAVLFQDVLGLIQPG